MSDSTPCSWSAGSLTRGLAAALIMAGQVRVDGHPATKAGALVHADAELTLVTPDHPYVGRGGLKLADALDRFQIDATGASRSSSPRSTSIRVESAAIVLVVE